MTVRPERLFFDERYDELREEIIKNRFSSTHGHGVAIILTQGLTQWMKTWTTCAPLEKRCENQRPIADKKVACDHKPEVVQIMTSLILGGASSSDAKGAANVV